MAYPRSPYMGGAHLFLDHARFDTDCNMSGKRSRGCGNTVVSRCSSCHTSLEDPFCDGSVRNAASALTAGAKDSDPSAFATSRASRSSSDTGRLFHAAMASSSVLFNGPRDPHHRHCTQTVSWSTDCTIGIDMGNRDVS